MSAFRLIKSVARSLWWRVSEIVCCLAVERCLMFPRACRPLACASETDTESEFVAHFRLQVQLRDQAIQLIMWQQLHDQLVTARLAGDWANLDRRIT